MFISLRLAAAWGGVAAATFAVVLTSATASEQPTLVSSNSLTIHKQLEVAARPPSWNGNIPCYENSHAVCEVDTYYGSADSGGNLRLAGEDNSLPVVSYIDGKTRYLPIPSSSSAMVYTAEPPYGLYLHFHYNLTSHLEKRDTASGSKYFITAPPDAALTDKSGRPLAAEPASMNFSSNGQWMVVSMPNVAMLRVNLSTFEVTPFATGFNYTIGIDPAVKTAITNNGRYAAVSSQAFGRTEVYDLSTCTDPPPTITGPVSCQSKNLQSYLQVQIPGFGYISHMHFLADDVLSFYAKSNAGNNGKYILAAQPGAVNFQELLALGDSFISGEGAFDYIAGTDTDENKCHTSLLSHPLLAGFDLNFNSYHSVACSGAVTQDIIDNGFSYEGQVKPRKSRDQYRDTEVNQILSQFQPGYIYQINFVEQYQPKIVLLSVGGNNVGFSDMIKKCLMPDTCYDSYESRLEFVQEVNRAFPELVKTYQKVKNAGPPDMRLYVVGYPLSVKPDGNCGINVRMNKEELEFAELANSYLNQIVRLATEKAGVFYVDVEDAFYGHRLCEATGEGSFAAHGITAGNDLPNIFGGPIGRESYHPNEFGQQLLENRILGATHSLTAPMPSPNPSATPPDTLGLPILVAPLLHTEVKNTVFTDKLAPDVVYKNQPFTMSLPGSNNGVAPFMAVEGSIWSTPTPIGSFTTDQNGDLSVSVNIPATIVPGFHTLHLTVKNLAGTLLDFYKTVYVASGATSVENGAGEPATIIELGANREDSGPVNIAFVPRVKLGDPAPATTQPASEQGSKNVLAASTNRQTPAKPSSEQATQLPRYGLIFLSGLSGLGLYLSKRFT